MVYKSNLSRSSILNGPEVLEIYNNIKNLINLCANSAQNENTIKETNSEEDITEKNILQLADELEKVKSDSSRMKIAAKKLEKDKTLLMEAVIKKLPKNIIKELLKYESGTVNSEGKDAFVYAAQGNRVDLIEMFISRCLYKQYQEAFILAAELNHLSFIQELMAYDEPKISEKVKQLALVSATSEKRLEVIRYLVRNINFDDKFEDPEEFLTTMITIFDKEMLEYIVEKEKILNLLNIAIKYKKEKCIFDTLLKEVAVDPCDKNEILELYKVINCYITKIKDVEKIDPEISNKILKIIENYLEEQKDLDENFYKFVIKFGNYNVSDNLIKAMGDKWDSLKKLLESIGDNDSKFLGIFINNINISSMPNEIINLIFDKLKSHLGKPQFFNSPETVENLFQIIEKFIRINDTIEIVSEQREFYNKVFKLSVDYKKENFLGMITKNHCKLLSRELFNLIVKNNIELANPIISNIGDSLIDKNLLVDMIPMLEEYLKALKVEAVGAKMSDKLWNIIKNYPKAFDRDQLTEKSVEKLFYLSTFYGNKNLFKITSKKLKNADSVMRAGLLFANEDCNGILTDLIKICNKKVFSDFNEEGENLLMEAAKNGYKKLVKNLLPVTNNKLEKDMLKNNVFTLAVIHGKYEIVDILISSDSMNKHFILPKDRWYRNPLKFLIIPSIDHLTIENSMHRLRINTMVDSDIKKYILNSVNTRLGVNIVQDFFDNCPSSEEQSQDQSKKFGEVIASDPKNEFSRSTTGDSVTTASEDSIITPRHSSLATLGSQIFGSVVQRIRRN